MDIKKMSAMQIANMSLEQFNKLTASEAKLALNKVRKRVNERLRSLDTLEYSSPAVEALKKAHPEKKAKLLPASKSRNSNMSELYKGMSFLKDTTAVKKGAEAHFQKVKQDLGLSDDASKDDVKDAYETFHKVQEEHGGILNKETNAERYSELKKAIVRWDRAEKTDGEIRKAIKDFYEKSENLANATTEDIIKGIEEKLFKPDEDEDTEEDTQI